MVEGRWSVLYGDGEFFMSYLDIWNVTELDYSISLAEAIEALESSSLCLLVLCFTKVDVHSLADAICSTIDVMEAIASSICALAAKAI
ncbi:QWRF motif-containing protein 2-like protein [Tanacetum coccineum]|uniref:QWRF motif-containing protein 2-like protein n=1 Tax=Tanacetum coccineum TaxID=301880 RepID=A0ABQ5AN17_9ASTR